MQRFLMAGLCAAALGPAAQADRDDLSWLEGCWRGEGLGGVVSECWMAGSGGLMIGSFMLESGGELAFSEHLLIGEAGGVDGYHVKHFTSELVGWDSREEYVTFPLVGYSPGRAEWEGLIYEQSEDGALTISLDMRQEDGSVSTIVFTLSRTR
ncbi:DUF6265 family protein [Maricaulis sp.]|uniref:DUF6265 family protein n=1 Tax=Maricaulis sp. TaxID=1486257 RepID=UPI002622555E|nr:DUF6265 family protein [Maricaulis sp.]